MKKFVLILLSVSMCFLLACAPDNTDAGDSPVNPDWPDGTIENLDEYDTSSYDLSRYMMPLWDDGGISYAETVFVIKEKDGTIKPVELLYPAKQIISVRSFGLDVKYEEDRDYVLTKDGKLQIKTDGEILAIDYSEFYFEEFDLSDGGMNKLVYGDGAQLQAEAVDSNQGMTKWQIAVTYKHSATWKNAPPAGQSKSLPNTNSKLSENKDVKIACLGDSISQGWTASGFKAGASGHAEGDQAVDLKPHMPPYFDLFIAKLKADYPDSGINFINLSRAGKTANWAIAEDTSVMTRLTTFSPDLILLAFGMNDGVDVGAIEFMKRIDKHITTIRESCPTAEIVLISTMNPNKDIVSWTGSPLNKHHDEYPAVLRALSAKYDGIVFADVQALFNNILKTKRFIDLTSNNINHPNDYGHRLYAQAVYKTVTG